MKTISITHRLLFALPFLFLLPDCQKTLPLANDPALLEDSFFVRYAPSDLQKMRWLAGVWKGVEAGRPIRQSFQFHGSNALEILFLDKNGDMNTTALMWDDGRYYFGQYRQWVVTWIGEKDVRFDPLSPGLSPMTWTRLNSQKWHLVRHAPGGDETTVMESAEGMHP